MEIEAPERSRPAGSRRSKTKRNQSRSSQAHFELSPRERQILEILYQRREGNGREVQASLADPPSYSAVRTTLRVLEQKGLVRHKERGLRYVFFPVIGREKARRSALSHLMRTFFEDSIYQVVSALLDDFPMKLTNEEIDRLVVLLKNARK
jgi:BlaI family penicillinase repressor